MNRNKFLPCSMMICSIQLLLLWAFRINHSAVLVTAVLLSFLMTFLVSSSELGLFTRKLSHIRDFAGDYRPMALQTGLLAAFDTAVFYLLRSHLGATVRLWLAVSITEILLVLLLLFVIGAARTMLFREPPKK